MNKKNFSIFSKKYSSSSIFLLTFLLLLENFERTTNKHLIDNLFRDRFGNNIQKFYIGGLHFGEV